MTPIASTIAVYHRATGIVVHVTSAELAPPLNDAALASVALPDDYAADTHSWDPATATMFPDVEKLRPRRWSWIKERREAAQLGGCMTPLGRVDTDPASQLKVAGSVQMAMLAQLAGAPFSVEWTMQDNSVVAHDAAAMIAMGLAVGQHVAACHEAAVARRLQLEAATTPEEIEAVTWPLDPQP